MNIVMILLISYIPRTQCFCVKYLTSGCQQTPPLPGPVLVVQVLVPGDPPPPDPEPGDQGAGHQDPPDGVRLQLLVRKRAPDLQTLKTEGAAPGAANDSR